MVGVNSSVESCIGSKFGFATREGSPKIALPDVDGVGSSSDSVLGSVDHAVATSLDRGLQRGIAS